MIVSKMVLKRKAKDDSLAKGDGRNWNWERFGCQSESRVDTMLVPGTSGRIGCFHRTVDFQVGIFAELM